MGGEWVSCVQPWMWPSGDDPIMCGPHPVEMFSVTVSPGVIVYWDIAAECICMRLFGEYLNRLLNTHISAAGPGVIRWSAGCRLLSCVLKRIKTAETQMCAGGF